MPNCGIQETLYSNIQRSVDCRPHWLACAIATPRLSAKSVRTLRTAIHRATMAFRLAATQDAIPPTIKIRTRQRRIMQHLNARVVRLRGSQWFPWQDRSRTSADARSGLRSNLDSKAQQPSLCLVPGDLQDPKPTCG